MGRASQANIPRVAPYRHCGSGWRGSGGLPSSDGDIWSSDFSVSSRGGGSGAAVSDAAGTAAAEGLGMAVSTAATTASVGICTSATSQQRQQKNTQFDGADIPVACGRCALASDIAASLGLIATRPPMRSAEPGTRREYHSPDMLDSNVETEASILAASDVPCDEGPAISAFVAAMRAFSAASFASAASCGVRFADDDRLDTPPAAAAGLPSGT